MAIGFFVSKDEQEPSGSEQNASDRQGNAKATIRREIELYAKRGGGFRDDQVGDAPHQGEVAGPGGDQREQVPELLLAGGWGGLDGVLEEEDGGDVGDDVGEAQRDGRESHGVVEVHAAGPQFGECAADEVLHGAVDDEESEKEQQQVPVDELVELGGLGVVGAEQQGRAGECADRAPFASGEEKQDDDAG